VNLSTSNLKAPRLLAAAICMTVAVLVTASDGFAQFSPAQLYPGFFELQTPGRLDAMLFSGGYISDQYGVVQQGFQLEQSITRYVGAFGRVTGYELFVGSNFSSPLSPDGSHSARFNFGRAQGGLEFMLYPGTRLYISGGKDFADSNADVIEGDFSSWLFLHSLHPVNFSFSSIHNYENRVTNTEIDVQALVLSRKNYMMTVGAGGAMYNGGIVGNASGQGGLDFGFYYRPWQIGLSVQAGYGSARQYGEITMYKAFDFLE